MGAPMCERPRGGSTIGEVFVVRPIRFVGDVKTNLVCKQGVEK